MRELIGNITSVEPEFEMQETNRGLKFLVNITTEDNEQFALTYDVMNVKGMPYYPGFSWCYPHVSDSFCQLCDLMSLIKCKNLEEMIGKQLRIRTNEGNTAISNSKGKRWIGHIEGIGSGPDTGCISGIFMNEQQVQHYLYQQ